jgi:hypothetical protein
MPTVLQFRRGTTAQNNAFTGSAGEVSIDTTKQALVVHDGSTAGGFVTASRESLYADIAERYHADDNYQPGTVLEHGGENEVTKTTSSVSTKIIGVVSSDPYCIMNSPYDQPEMRDNAVHPAIALLGRTPTFVTGPCSKGDLMVSSNNSGCAMAWTDNTNPPAGSIIGKAVENKLDDETGIIEILIGRN